MKSLLFIISSAQFIIAPFLFRLSLINSLIKSIILFNYAAIVAQGGVPVDAESTLSVRFIVVSSLKCLTSLMLFISNNLLKL